MGFLLEGIGRAVNLLIPPHTEIVAIIGLSLFVSGLATVIAGIVAIPIGIFISLKKFPGRRLLIGLLQSAMAVPAVLIGLVVYLLVNRQGLLGFLGLLFTPTAIIIAQALLAFPLIAALTVSALRGVAKDSLDLSRSFGANFRQTARILIRQGRFAFLAALITGFSRVIGETGMTLMIGGNIKGETRVMTTAISLETMKGNFETGLALGIVLLSIAILINLALGRVQGKGA